MEITEFLRNFYGIFTEFFYGIRGGGVFFNFLKVFQFLIFDVTKFIINKFNNYFT